MSLATSVTEGKTFAQWKKGLKRTWKQWNKQDILKVLKFYHRDFDTERYENICVEALRQTFLQHAESKYYPRFGTTYEYYSVLNVPDSDDLLQLARNFHNEYSKTAPKRDTSMPLFDGEKKEEQNLVDQLPEIQVYAVSNFQRLENQFLSWLSSDRCEFCTVRPVVVKHELSDGTKVVSYGFVDLVTAELFTSRSPNYSLINYHILGEFQPYSPWYAVALRPDFVRVDDEYKYCLVGRDNNNNLHLIENIMTNYFVLNNNYIEFSRPEFGNFEAPFGRISKRYILAYYDSTLPYFERYRHRLHNIDSELIQGAFLCQAGRAGTQKISQITSEESFERFCDGVYAKQIEKSRGAFEIIIEDRHSKTKLRGYINANNTMFFSTNGIEKKPLNSKQIIEIRELAMSSNYSPAANF